MRTRRTPRPYPVLLVAVLGVLSSACAPADIDTAGLSGELTVDRGEAVVAIFDVVLPDGLPVDGGLEHESRVSVRGGGGGDVVDALGRYGEMIYSKGVNEEAFVCDHDGCRGTFVYVGQPAESSGTQEWLISASYLHDWPGFGSQVELELNDVAARPVVTKEVEVTVETAEFAGDTAAIGAQVTGSPRVMDGTPIDTSPFMFGNVDGAYSMQRGTAFLSCTGPCDGWNEAILAPASARHRELVFRMTLVGAGGEKIGISAGPALAPGHEVRLDAEFGATGRLVLERKNPVAQPWVLVFEDRAGTDTDTVVWIVDGRARVVTLGPGASNRTEAFDVPGCTPGHCEFDVRFSSQPPGFRDGEVHLRPGLGVVPAAGEDAGSLTIEFVAD